MESKFWKRKRVLVTGGSGFVGRWVGRLLQSADAELHILDLAPPKEYEVQYQFHCADLRDLKATTALLDHLNPAVIIHLAGQPGVQTSHDDPRGAYEANVCCTFNLLDACRGRSSVESLVAVSSNHVYGEQHHLPTREDVVLNGVAMYAASKLCADVLARTYGKVYNVPVGVARMTNSYGPDDHHTSHIITGTILACLNEDRPVIKQSGRDRKGYLYIEDTAEGLLAVAAGIARDHALWGEAFNLAPDEAVTVLDLVRMIMATVGMQGEPVVQRASAPHEEEHLDNAKARRVLDWTPRFTLPSGLRKSIDWYRLWQKA